jgi:hypothetical protein
VYRKQIIVYCYLERIYLHRLGFAQYHGKDLATVFLLRVRQKLQMDDAKIAKGCRKNCKRMMQKLQKDDAKIAKDYV